MDGDMQFAGHPPCLHIWLLANTLSPWTMNKPAVSGCLSLQLFGLAVHNHDIVGLLTKSLFGSPLVMNQYGVFICPTIFQTVSAEGPVMKAFQIEIGHLPLFPPRACLTKCLNQTEQSEALSVPGHCKQHGIP